MPVRILIILLLPWLAGPGFAQDSSGETAKVKEQELAEVRELAGANPLTADIDTFLILPSFPVDIRHNAKIFREKLALWAAKRLGRR